MMGGKGEVQRCVVGGKGRCVVGGKGRGVVGGKGGGTEVCGGREGER